MSRIITPSATFTRPTPDTTQYTSGDLVANSATNTAVAAMQFNTGKGDASGLITRARLAKSDDDPVTASFRLHLFSTNPCATAPSNGDNGALQLAIADGEQAYLGYFDLDLTASAVDIFTTGNAGVSAAGQIRFNLASSIGAIYGLLEARAGYTPAAAEVFTVTLEIELED
jgi:hypothetical protein